MNEGRYSGLSAVPGIPVVPIGACAGQPVQHCFIPPAPSSSVMVQGALLMKAAELKCVMMAFIVPMACDQRLGSPIAEDAEKLARH